MCGNGAATGREIIVVAHRPILKVLTMGRSTCFVAAAVVAMRGTVVLLAATTTAPVTAASALGSACPYKFCFEVNESTRQQVNETMCQQERVATNL